MARSKGRWQVTHQPPYFSPEDLTDVDGILYFRGMTVPLGVELWRTDGTPEGTQFVADTNPNNYGGPGPGNLTNIDGTLYFTGGWWSDVELWRSDGTAAGTYEVADIYPTHGSGPNNMIGFDGDVFFTANDGVHGHELWRTDGTPAGTRLVKDIRPGEVGAGVDNTTDFRMTVAGGKLYFIADDGEHGKELWASDGTTEGTQLVLDITPGPDAHINQLVEFNNTLYFGVYGEGENKGIVAQRWHFAGHRANQRAIGCVGVRRRRRNALFFRGRWATWSGTVEDPRNAGIDGDGGRCPARRERVRPRIDSPRAVAGRRLGLVLQRQRR